MADSAPNAKSDALKRRSTRIVQAVPLTVTGVDALGRPFEERTSTSILNCHGCRYQSKHYVLKNMWVTLEVPHPESGRPPRTVRGKVMWIQRPRTVRELFQIGLELEVPGNIWGIAFCPPDWFPFPDSGAKVASPAAEMLPEAPTELMPAENTTWSDASEQTTVADKVRTMPMAAPVSSPAEAAAAPPQEATVLPGESQERLRAEVRDYAAEAVASEARRLLASLQEQLQQASEKAAQAATAAAAQQAIQNAVAKAEALAEERLRTLADRWSEDLGKNLEQQYRGLAAQTGELEPARREALAQQLQTQVNEGLEQLRSAVRDSQAAIQLSRENLEELRRETENSIAAALQDTAQQLKTQSEDGRTRVSELENIQRQAIEKLTSAFASAEVDWRARLDASMAAANSRWDDRLSASSERAAQQLSERLAVNSLLSREQFEKELAERVAGAQKSIQDAAADAENRLRATQASFESRIGQAQSLFAQAQASTQALEEQVRQIEATHKTAREELERRAAALVDIHSQELARNGEHAIAAWTARLQPSLEAAGLQTIGRLGAQLEQQLASQMHRASQALSSLEAQSIAAEEMLHKYEQALTIASTQTIDAANAQLQKQVEALENNFQETGQTVIQRWIAEIESKATETTHTTFESLYKTADWYEKKLQTQMQAALEKGLEQGVSQLREKAGEISRLFAGELDHYSRSYVGHTQEQIEEAGREAQERAKKLSQELTVSTVYSAAQQMQGKADAALGDFQGKMSAALGQHAAQMEEQVRRTQADAEAATHRLSAEFNAAITAQTQQALAGANSALAAQTETAREQLRAHSSESEKQLRDALAAASDQGIETYKQRLESAANSWLLTTVSRLNQQSGQQLDALNRAAESRLNETCKQVFAQMGEALHRQMIDLAPTTPAAPPVKDSGSRESQ